MLAAEWRGRLLRGPVPMWLMQPAMVGMITANSLLTRERMSHDNGIVARGRIRLLDDMGAIPSNRFFTPGRSFEAALRHASITFADDAALQVRAASLKFSSGPIRSECDLLMNGGEAAPFWNMDTFWQFMRARVRGGRAHLIAYFQRNPRCYFNVRDALRRNPESFTDQRYYTQTPLRFIADDGVERYAKFRLVPADDGVRETGIPGEDDLQTPWFQDALPGETRHWNYLKDEYRERLRDGGAAHYRLQIQLLEWQPHHERAVELSSLYAWDEREHPWHDLARVEMNEVVDDPLEAQGYLFSLRNLPEGTLEVIPARGFQDGPSMDRLRLGGYWPRRARLAMLRLRGPKPPSGNPRAVRPDRSADRTTSLVRSCDVAERPQIADGILDADYYTRERRLDVQRGLYQYAHGFIRWGSNGYSQDVPDFSLSDHPWYQEVFLDARDNTVCRGDDELKPLPPFVRDLSASERFSAYIEGRLYRIIGASVLSSGASLIEQKLSDWKGLDVYRRFYAGYRTKPRSLTQWHHGDDVEFARQRLAGTNPMMLRRLDAIPPKFPVTDEAVEGLLPLGETLATAMERKRLFWCDYKVLEGISVRRGRFLAVPMVLFYKGENEPLRPIAIQLQQRPGDNAPIFTPRDGESGNWLWTAVKAYVQSADAQVHEVVEHLVRAHMIVEVFEVAMHRALPNSHPIHKMLDPHMEYTMAVNNSARTKMLAPDGPIDRTMAIGAVGAYQLIARAWWDEWDFATLDPRVDVEDRGIGDREILDYYPWRDDALALWSIVERYARGMVDLFYADDAAVERDDDLCAFHHEIVDPRHGHVRDVRSVAADREHLLLEGEKRGFGNKATLVSVIARLIFIASGGHAAVNNGQYDAYGFVPNVPGAMHREPPRTKERWSERDFVAALPGFKATSVQIVMARLLSRPTEMPLGRFHPNFFAGTDRVRPVVDRFRRELHELHRAIQQRNDALPPEDRYTYLDPVQVPCSITA